MQYDLKSSQVAIFDDECFRRPLSPVRECVEDHDSGIATDPIDRDLGNVRTSRKQLFGAGAWLGSSATLEVSPPKVSKYKSLIDLENEFKQQVEGIAVDAVDMAKAHPLPFYGPRQAKVLPTPTVAISFDPTVQAKLYSEMEMMISVSANKLLTDNIPADASHYREGQQLLKNRSEVAEFQYDQTTQRQLTPSNIRTLLQWRELHKSSDSSFQPSELKGSCQGNERSDILRS
ncbi:hypothetical protein BDV06DRAFT_218713 [Aspergillus oleicola]